MDFNTSTETTGEFSSNDLIVRQSSDRDPVTGLIKYSIHTALKIQAGVTVYGQWRSHEVDLVPESVEVICSRMGITLEELNEIGGKYTLLLMAIVDYSKNPPAPPTLEP